MNSDLIRITLQGRMIAAPFFFVTFADFWLADQLNSLAAALLDFEFLLCFYVTNGNWLEVNGEHSTLYIFDVSWLTFFLIKRYFNVSAERLFCKTVSSLFACVDSFCSVPSSLPWLQRSFSTSGECRKVCKHIFGRSVRHIKEFLSDKI